MQNLIIGNGFDLSLGLKTSYNDFLVSHHFDLLIAHKNTLALQLKKNNELNNWIDIENEIPQYSNHIYLGETNVKQEFEALKKSLMNFLKESQEGDINKNSPAFKMIEKEINTTGSIYNFNYTNSIFRVLDAIGFDYKKDDEFHYHVHGSIGNSDIILGVEDQADIQTEHIFFKKSYNLNFGKSSIGYLLHPDYDLVLFGHSLGITDSSYFSKYFKTLSTGEKVYSNLKFYYYGESSYTDLMIALDLFTDKDLTGLKNNNDVKFVDSSK